MQHVIHEYHIIAVKDLIKFPIVTHNFFCKTAFYTSFGKRFYTKVNKHTLAERIAQTVDDYKISRQNKYSIL